MSDMLKCSKCGKLKTTNSFYIRKNRPKGFTSLCKQCISDYKKTPVAKKRQMELYYENHEKRLKIRKEQRKKHIIREREYDKEYYIENKKQIDYNQQICALNNKIITTQVYTKHTMKCNLCGEDDIDVLTIDHIEHDGSKYSSIVRKNIYRFLIKNNFPDGYRVLCRNCNWREHLRWIDERRNERMD